MSPADQSAAEGALATGTGSTAQGDAQDAAVESELLVEEVSIDGMCGVY
ncbi:mycofactocin precursor MftA [Streptomyces sp. NPDC002181]